MPGSYQFGGRPPSSSPIRSKVIANGALGTDLCKELKKDGWEAVFWTPDSKSPNESGKSLRIHSTDIRNAMKPGGSCLCTSW